MECEIRWCRKQVDVLIPVDELIGDASYRVGICEGCATKLGLKAGDTLPSSDMVRQKIEEEQ